MRFLNYKNILRKREKFGRLSYSQEGEDLILEEFFLNKPNGFYIDIGAFHPTRFSNTKIFYDKGWNGINIEPSPLGIKYFEKDRARDINLNLGISDKELDLTLYSFEEPALNTFQKSRVEFLEKNTPYRTSGTVKVPVKRLDTILETYAFNKSIDFMDIDVETFEIQVLKSNNWLKFRPSLILIEILDFSLETISKNLIHKYLKKQGYEFMCKTPRTCFYIEASAKC